MEAYDAFADAATTGAFKVVLQGEHALADLSEPLLATAGVE
jgi:hypothetical protein